jgi:tetratricopeptide (TPR) repeat protein
MIKSHAFARGAVWLLVFFISSGSIQAQSGAAFDRGMNEFRAGKYSSAAELFAEAEAASPGATDALLYRAKSLVKLRKFAQAEQSLRAYLKSHEKSSDALYLLGFVLNREDRPADSLQIYTTAAAIATPTSDDLKIVGLDYVLLDDYPDAIKWLKKSVAFDSKNKDAWYYLGRAYYTKARLSDARAAFEKTLELDPTNVRAESNLGLVYESEGRVQDAIAAYRQAIAWQSDDLQPSEQSYVNLGRLLMEQNHSQEARGLLEKAVALAPNNAYCHLILGEYYRKSGQFRDAQRELERATQLDPGNAAGHYQLGRAYKETHQLDRAEAEFKRAEDLKARQAGLHPGEAVR